MSNLENPMRALLAVVVVLLILPQSALAGSGGVGTGVHVDPGSPAAKEYAIPLGTARGNGTPSDTGNSQPLFGAGITRSSSATTPSRSTVVKRAHPRHRSRSPRHHTHRGVTAGGSAGRRDPPSPRSVIGAGGSSGAGISWMLAAAAAVLLLGGIGAAALSRRARANGPAPRPR